MRLNFGRISEIIPLVKLLEVGLRNLTFAENFRSNVVQVELAANTEVIIPHSLKKSPSYYIIGRKSNIGEIIDGSTWDERNISLNNTSANSIKLTVIIME